jgi:replicative superfamily II helicase
MGCAKPLGGMTSSSQISLEVRQLLHYAQLLHNAHQAYETIHLQHVRVPHPLDSVVAKIIFNMFRTHKTLDVITLFHKSSLAPSVRIANLLKQASAQAAETATEDQASDHSHQTFQIKREPFELDITEAPPTADQLSSILEYVGAGKAAQLVKGASSQSDALKKLKETPDNFVHPVVRSYTHNPHL